MCNKHCLSCSLFPYYCNNEDLSDWDESEISDLIEDLEDWRD